MLNDDDPSWGCIANAHTHSVTVEDRERNVVYWYSFSNPCTMEDMVESVETRTWLKKKKQKKLLFPSLTLNFSLFQSPKIFPKSTLKSLVDLVEKVHPVPGRGPVPRVTFQGNQGSPSI